MSYNRVFSNRIIDLEVDLENILDEEGVPEDERYDDKDELKIKVGTLRKLIEILPEIRDALIKGRS